MAEMWDLVDKDGNKVGIKWPREDHGKIPDGLYHPCVEVWVKIGDNILLTLRHPDKSEGGKYDCPGGGVVSGEELIDAAMRELMEEVGISVNKEEMWLLGAVGGRRAYAASYLVCLDSLPKLVLQPTEVVGYRLAGEREIQEMENQLTVGTYRRFLLYRHLIFPNES